MGRRSPSRAGLLDGSSLISSTTTIVRAALIEKVKKGPHVFRCPVLQEQKKVYTSSDVVFSTENIGETVA